MNNLIIFSLQDARRPTGVLARWRNSRDDFRRIFYNPNNYPALARVLNKYISTQALDVSSPAASPGQADDESFAGKSWSWAHCGLIERQQSQGSFRRKPGKKQVRKDATSATYLSWRCVSISGSRWQVQQCYESAFRAGRSPVCQNCTSFFSLIGLSVRGRSRLDVSGYRLLLELRVPQFFKWIY